VVVNEVTALSELGGGLYTDSRFRISRTVSFARYTVLLSSKIARNEINMFMIALSSKKQSTVFSS
jgi:hypothetical protein